MIDIENVSLTVPVYNIGNISIRKRLMHIFFKEKNFDNVKNVNILNNINLKIKQGDRVSVIGKNGSGKTTLLRILAGIYKPTTGKIKISKKTTPLLDISLGFDSEATGYENIYFRSYMLGMKKKEIEAKINSIIEFSELQNEIHNPIRTYSTGMYLRLAFSVCMFVDPEILILDEWISVGDNQFIKKANKKLEELVNKSSSFIIATHSESQALKYTNRSLLISKGNIVFDGHPEEAIKIYNQENKN